MSHKRKWEEDLLHVGGVQTLPLDILCLCLSYLSHKDLVGHIRRVNMRLQTASYKPEAFSPSLTLDGSDRTFWASDRVYTSKNPIKTTQLPLLKVPLINLLSRLHYLDLGSQQLTNAQLEQLTPTWQKPVRLQMVRLNLGNAQETLSSNVVQAFLASISRSCKTLHLHSAHGLHHAHAEWSCLQTLHLTSCDITHPDWASNTSSSFFSSLTEFMVDISDHNHAAITAVCAFIRQMPKLQHLHVHFPVNGLDTQEIRWTEFFETCASIPSLKFTSRRSTSVVLNTQWPLALRQNLKALELHGIVIDTQTLRMLMINTPLETLKLRFCSVRGPGSDTKVEFDGTYSRVSKLTFKDMYVPDVWNIVPELLQSLTYLEVATWTMFTVPNALQCRLQTLALNPRQLSDLHDIKHFETLQVLIVHARLTWHDYTILVQSLPRSVHTLYIHCAHKQEEEETYKTFRAVCRARGGLCVKNH